MADKIINIAEQARQKIKLEKLKHEYGIETITGAELAAKVFPPIKWAVPGLLPEGYGILGGKPKIGKSWLAYDLALAVASGGYAIGSNEYPVEPGTALYLALEDNQRRLQDRQKTLLNGQAGGPDNLHLTTDWKRLHEGGLNALEAWLEAHQDCRLVIIDTLARIKPRLKRGADAYEHETLIGGQLQAIAVKYHICILVICHVRKSKSDTNDFIDEIGGSVGITGAADFVAQLSRGRQENTGILQISGRDLPGVELALKFENCLWTLLGDAQIVKLSGQRLKILEVLREAGKAIAPKQIAELADLSYDSCKHLISKLFNDGYIEPDGYGKYKIKI